MKFAIMLKIFIIFLISSFYGNALIASNGCNDFRYPIKTKYFDSLQADINKYGLFENFCEDDKISIIKQMNDERRIFLQKCNRTGAIIAMEKDDSYFRCMSDCVAGVVCCIPSSVASCCCPDSSRMKELDKCYNEAIDRGLKAIAIVENDIKSK